MSRFFRNAFLLLAAVWLAGCTTPWPNLPSEEYRGVVIDRARNRPESHAKVTAIRPARRGVPVAPVGPEVIGTAVTSADGRFRLKTRTGYATELHASSFDRSLGGGIGVASEHTGLVIETTPQLSPASYGSFDPDSDTARFAEAIALDIIWYISAHPREPLHSLASYEHGRVITRQQLLFVTSQPALFFGPSAPFQFRWGNRMLAFPSATAPVKLREISR